MSNELKKTCLALSATLWLGGCSASHSSAEPALNSLSDIRIGIGEKRLASAKSLLMFDPAGHFGDKVQYDSLHAGQGGSSYALHCRGGRCFGIEVKYPEPGIKRASAIKVMDQLIQGVAPALSEHDDQDLRLKDSKEPGEFFYYGDKLRVELHYSEGKDPSVKQIGVWLS